MALSELASGLLRWTARHPEWHPSGFGDEVGSYALGAYDYLLLVDPLLPEDEPEPVLDALDAMLRSRVAILVTIGYHVRSAGRLWKRWHADVPVTIHGPPQDARRLAAGAATAFQELEPGTPGPAGVEAFAIGRPRRGERPLWLPSHASLAFGDAVVTTPGGALRMWAQEPLHRRGPTRNTRARPRARRIGRPPGRSVGRSRDSEGSPFALAAAPAIAAWTGHRPCAKGVAHARGNAAPRGLSPRQRARPPLP